MPNYYTIYDYDGTNPVGYEDPENYGVVGKNNLIYKTNEVLRSGKFAIKTVDTEYKYTMYPELPLNNKFERGTFMGTAGNIATYTIDDWEYGIVSGTAPFTLTPTTNSHAYTRRNYNIYGIELSRELIIEKDGNNITWLRSEGMLVNEGDKFNLSFNQKFTTNFASGTQVFARAAQIYVTDGTNYYHLGNNYQDRHLEWDNSVGSFIVVDYFGATTDFSSVSIDPPPIPINGTLYIVFPVSGSGLATGTAAIRTGIEFTYSPYVANGYIQVKGDKITRSQVANFIDKLTTEVFMSDTNVKVAKGCLFRENGITATVPTWYRYGNTEALHFKELINLGQFNLGYRRFFKFQGTFTSTKYSPQNDQTNTQPLSFRKTYKFVDLPEQPECVLVAPLNIDYKTGWITAIFEEVRRASLVPVPESMTELLHRIVTAINSTTNWGGGAPAGGTIGYPPQAALVTSASVPRSINVHMDAGNDLSVTYTIGAAANSPSITITYNQIIVAGISRLVQFQLGPDIAIGNTFIISAYGHDVAVTVQATANASFDGRQVGDSSSFNYLFE